MKNLFKITCFTLALLISFSCKKDGNDVLDNELEIQQLRDRLCVVKDVPVEYLTFTEEVGTIEELYPGIYKDQFIIRLDNFKGTPLISCKLSENLKVNGLKIKLTGVSYKLKCVPSSTDGCKGISDDNGKPVDIKTIVAL